MDRFVRFNRKNIQDRQMDTLIGLAKGITADGSVNQEEAKCLHNWLIQNCYSENPFIKNLLEKLSGMLEDDMLDTEETSELLSILRKISGDPSGLGELAKTSILPIDLPLPDVSFPNKKFLFSGNFTFGLKKDCHTATRALGGVIEKSVTKKLDYLVLGTYANKSWAHESLGRKIEKAIEYRGKGVPIVIITEEHWLKEGNIE